MPTADPTPDSAPGDLHDEEDDDALSGDEAGRSPPPVELTVGSGGRLDAFLVGHFADQGQSRASLQGWISAGRVRLLREGGELPAGKASLKLRPGDRVRVEPPAPPPPPAPLEPEDLPVPILYQDEAILVVDKPPGLTVHPGPGQRRGTLAGALLHLSPGRLSSVGGPERPGIVHRLDKDTSGVMVIARTDRAHRELGRQFHDRLVQKTYLALVEGCPRPPQGTVDKPLGRHPKDRKKMAVVEDGRSAQTGYEVTERYRGFSLVRCRPRTGRTHQIRVHLRSLGTPIVADAVYGKRQRLAPEDVGLAPGPAWLERQALHAFRLELTHPESGLRVTFEAPLPADFQAALTGLDNLASG